MNNQILKDLEGKRIGRDKEIAELKRTNKLVTDLNLVNFKEFIESASCNDESNQPDYIEYMSYKGFVVLQHREEPYEFIIEKDGFTKKIYSYENQAIYGNAEFILFKGWDYDIWFDTISMKTKKIETR